MEELHSLTIKKLTPTLIEWLAKCPKLIELQFTRVSGTFEEVTAVLPNVKNFACDEWRSGSDYIEMLPIMMPCLEIIILADPEEVTAGMGLLNTILYPFTRKLITNLQSLQVLVVDSGEWRNKNVK
jgi:hypothetical protein